MTSRKTGRFVVLVSAVALGAGLAGCSSSVSASDVANTAKTRFNQQFAAQGKAERIASVSCPRDLPNKVGASEVCTGVGTPGNAQLNISARITAIHGSTAHLDFNLTVASGAPSGTSTG